VQEDNHSAVAAFCRSLNASAAISGLPETPENRHFRFTFFFVSILVRNLFA
jgi:hypothetical protein